MGRSACGCCCRAWWGGPGLHAPAPYVLHLPLLPPAVVSRLLPSFVPAAFAARRLDYVRRLDGRRRRISPEDAADPLSADLLGGSRGDHTSSCCPASHRPESTGPGQQSDAPGPFWLVLRPGRGGRIKDGGSGGLVAAFAPRSSGTPSRRARAPAKRGRAGPRWGTHGGRQRPARGPRASACSLLAIALVFARAHFGLFQERVHQFAGLRPAALPFSPLLLAGGQRVPVGGVTIHGWRLHCACAIQYTAGGVEKVKGA